MNQSIKGALLALLAFALFAVHDVFLKLLGATYSPFQILFFAVLFSFPFAILPLLYDKTEANLRPKHPYWLALRTACALLGGVCAVYAFSVLPLSQTYALLFSMPLLVTLIAVPILGERVGWHRLGSVVVGLIGVIIVLQPQASTLSSGHAAALAAAGFAALGSTIIRKIGREERAVVMLLLNLMTTFVIMGALLRWHYEPMPIDDLGLVILVAIFSLLAVMVLIAAYRAAQATIVAPMQYSQIIWAVLFGYLWFDEMVAPTTLLGAGLVILSGLYVLWRETRSGASQNQPVLSTRDQRPALAYRPRVGDFFRLWGSRDDTHDPN